MSTRRIPAGGHGAPILQESALSALLDASPVPMWVYDAQTLRILAVNERALVYFGCRREQFIALPPTALETVPAEAAPHNLAALREGAALRQFRKPDGTTIVMRLETSPLEIDGRAACLAAATDLTKASEALARLGESEHQLRQLLEASSDYSWEQDARFQHSSISPSYAKLLGVPVEDVVGKRLLDIPGMSVETKMGIMALKAHKEKQPYRDFIYSRRMPDGTRRWFRSSGTPFFDRNGVFQGYRGIGAEITRHVEAEAAAKLVQQGLHEAVAHVAQPIVVFDAEDRVVGYNHAFIDLHLPPNVRTCVDTGVPFVDIAQWQLRNGFYASGPDDPKIDLETLLARYQTEAEHSYRLSDGRWMQVTYRRLPGRGRVGLWTDITALKHAEVQRHALERQLHHAQRLDALGTLAGGVAHEINNALVPVIALTKLVAGHLPEESRDRRNLATVIAGAERSRDLVKQVLAFSRKEETGPEAGHVDLGAVLREALHFLHATLPTSIRLEEKIAPTPPVLGDAQQLHQVIVNLITNAAHAIGTAQGRISVSLRLDQDPSTLRLSVADTGCGMDDATKARIFEPFFTTKGVGDGTGLGLSVVHGIIEKHGGRIDVESAPGSGSCFTIMMPVAKAAAVV
jgi:PAS domain S-box-containing protein